MKFSIRDLFLVTLIVAVLVAWWLDHRQRLEESAKWRREAESLRAENEAIKTIFVSPKRLLPTSSVPAPNPPAISRSDDTDKTGVLKLKQTVTINVGDCLRDEIKSLIANGEKETAEDWSQVLQECAALEFEVTDVRKATLDGKGLEYLDSDKPKLRTVMPITKKTLESQKRNSQKRMLFCITGEVGSIEIHKNSKGEITSKTALIRVEWSDLNGKGIRTNPQVELLEYAFKSFTITIDSNK